MSTPVTNEETIEQLLTQVVELKAEVRQLSNLLSATHNSKEELWNFAFRLESKIEELERELPKDC